MKEAIKKRKGNLQNGKTYLRMCLTRGSYSKYRKNPHNSISKSNQIKNNKSVNKQVKGLSRYFPKDKKTGQKEHERMPSITRHYRNPKQHHNGMPSHACQSGHQKKTTGNKHW